MSAENSDPGDRRPLASRNTQWARKITQRLAKTAIQPNHISIACIVFSVVAAGLFYIGGQTAPSISSAICLLFAALACQCRLLCNLFDGMLAIEAGRRTRNGLAWNEFPDRYADIVIFVGIGYGINLPSLGWAAACFSVLTAYTRELSSTTSGEADFSGPMAKQHRMAVVTIAAVIAAIVGFISPEVISNSSQTILTLALVLIVIGALITALRRTQALLKRLE